MSLPDDRPENLVAHTTTALILLDVENRFFWSDRGARELASVGIIPKLERVLSAARDHGILRIIVTVAHAPEADTEPWVRRRKYLRAGLADRLDDSDWGRSVVDSLTPRDDEVHLKKVRTSAFFGTPLDTYLRRHAIETILLTGVASNGAILATTTDAVARDFYCIVVGDATVGTTAALHEAALTVIGRENVIDTETLCRVWGS